MALVALIVVAALGAGASIATRESRRAAVDEIAQLRASAAAEGALERTLDMWDRRHNLLPPGRSDSTVVAGDPSAIVRTLRLDATRLLVESFAAVRAAAPGAAGRAERTIARIARLERPVPDARAALTIGGAIDLPDGVTIDGRDTPPPGWSGCPSSRADSAAIAAFDTTLVRRTPGAIVRGAVRGSAAAGDSSTYASFRGESWTSLVARADAVIDPASGPWSPTIVPNDYPLVVASGGLTMRGPSSGQGTLLVSGDLTIVGNVKFAGTIVVRGALRASGGALTLHGALLVASGASTLGASSIVTFSQCAVGRAADIAARLLPDGRRSWAEVTR